MSPYERLAWQALKAEIEIEYLSDFLVKKEWSIEKLLKSILKDANIELNKLNFWALVQKGEDLVKAYHK